MSKGHRSEVPELYCVFASKTLQRKVRPKGVFCCERHGRLDRKLFAASDNKSTLLQEVEKRHEQGVYITKKRCAELDGAARLRLNFCD